MYLCFSSDFLLQDADGWRAECWQMMRERQDLHFLFLTKRIERFMDCIPADWGTGYDNVTVGCTVENQAMVDYKLSILTTYLFSIKTSSCSRSSKRWIFGRIFKILSWSSSAVNQILTLDRWIMIGSWTFGSNAKAKTPIFNSDNAARILLKTESNTR